MSCLCYCVSMNAEERTEPYPLEAVNDLTRNYSSEHFTFLIGHCRDVISRVVSENTTSSEHIARVNMLKHL